MEIRIEKSKKYNEIIGEHDEFTLGVLTKSDWEILYRRMGNFYGNELLISLKVDTKQKLAFEDVVPYATITIDKKENPYIITSYDVFNRAILKKNGIDKAYLDNESNLLRHTMKNVLRRENRDYKIY